MQLPGSCLLHTAVAALLCAGFAAAAAADLYKWVDEHGVTHYSDVPPEDYEWEPVSGDLSIIQTNREAGPVMQPGAQRAASDDAGRARDEQRRTQELEERRAQLLQECEKNRGVECEREVDTELRAERLLESGQIMRRAPPLR
jgi:Domain of unknown function (DUF4124)